MGRHILVAGIAMLVASGTSIAKPEQSNRGKPNHVDMGSTGYGAGGCPPGLQKKNAPCMPPGRYKKLFEIGERVPSGYKGLMSYNSLPYDLRMAYGGTLDRRARYLLDQQYLYRVDPETMIVRQILRTLP